MADLNNIKLTPRQNVIAVIFMLVILLTLGLRLYFSGKALELSGPDFIASNDSIAAMVYNMAIYRLDERGNILQRIAFTDIGIQAKIADFQLLDNQRFVIGDWEKERILLCYFEGPTCDSLTNNLGKHIQNFFKFHYSESENELFISDTDRHRVLHYNLNTHAVKQISAKRQFKFPNHLQIEDDGYLYVTDTNHHRIAHFEFDGDSLKEVGKEIRVPKNVSNKKWPVFYYLRDNGDMYILQGNNFLLHADLIYIPTKGEPENIATAINSDMTSISRMQNHILLCDRKLFTLFSLNLENHDMAEFGSEELKRIFRQDRKTTKLREVLSTAMLVLMFMSIAAMVGFIIFLATYGKRTRPPKSIAGTSSDYSLPPIQPGQLVWVGENRLFRYLMPLFIILIFLFAGTAYVWLDLHNIDLLHAKPDTPEQGILYALIIIGLIFFMAMVNAIFNVYTKIGTDGIHIHIDRLGNKYQFDPREILYSPHYLVCGRLVLPYRNIFMHYFRNKEQFEAYISPLLKTHGRKIRTFTDVLWHLIKHPTMMGIFNTIILIITCILLYKALSIDIINKLS